MQFIRDHANSVWAKILLIGVGVSLAGIGGTQIFSGPSADTIASVDGSKITLQEVEAQYQLLLNNYAQNVELTEELQRQYKLIAREDLIQRRALNKQAEDWKIRASDRAVAEKIIEVPAFQKNGVFDQETYKQALFYSGYNIETFEDNVRRDVEDQVIREAFALSAFASEKALTEELEYIGQTRDIAVATYNYKDQLNNVAVSDDEIAARYDTHKDQFVTPNRIRVQYIELTPELLGSNSQAMPSAEMITAEMAKLKKANEQRASEQFTIEYSNEAEKNQALQLLTDLNAQLRTGAISFDEAKAKMKEVPNAYYNKNGNFKYGTAGIPEFDDALFALTEENPYSAPFATDGEVHLVHLLGITSPFANEKALEVAAVNSLKEKQQADQYLQAEARMQQLAETYTESLDEIAQDLGVPLKETQWLNLDQPEGFLANPTVWDALNTVDVRDNHRNSLPFAFNNEDNHAMIVRIASQEDRRQKTLEESFDEIKAELAMEKAKSSITALVNAMLEAGDVESFQNDIEQLGFAYNQYNDLAITSIGNLQAKPVEQTAISNGFEKVKQLKNHKPEYLVEDVDGHIVVVAINKITKGESADFPEEVKMQLREYLDARAGSYEYQALLLYIKNHSNIKLYNSSFFN